jgi:hypothetical protein
MREKKVEKLLHTMYLLHLVGSIHVNVTVIWYWLRLCSWCQLIVII